MLAARSLLPLGLAKLSKGFRGNWRKDRKNADGSWWSGVPRTGHSVPYCYFAAKPSTRVVYGRSERLSDQRTFKRQTLVSADAEYSPYGGIPVKPARS
jgi:hypothetical protein